MIGNDPQPSTFIATLPTSDITTPPTSDLPPPPTSVHALSPNTAWHPPTQRRRLSTSLRRHLRLRTAVDFRLRTTADISQHNAAFFRLRATYDFRCLYVPSYQNDFSCLNAPSCLDHYRCLYGTGYSVESSHLCTPKFPINFFCNSVDVLCWRAKTHNGVISN